MRLAKQGKNEGNFFWGCSDYPKCKGVQDATDQDVAEYNNAEAPKTHTVLLNPVLTNTPEAPVSNIARVINESQSSYEFGPAKNRHKIYYNTVKDLIAKMDVLRDADLIESDLEIEPKDFAKENGAS